MFTLIVIASLLVIATIILSLATAYDIGRQRTSLSSIDKALLSLEDEVQQLGAQTKAARDMLDIHRRQRDERVSRIKELMSELNRLEQEEAAEREVGVSNALLKRSLDEAPE